MTPPGFDILLEDNALLVVNKPGGLLTQAPPGIDSLELRARRWLQQRDEKPGGIYLAVLHRLDRPVSGALALAKNVRAARRIAEQFQGRLVEKTYWALVHDRPAPPEGSWIDYIRKLPDEPRAETVERGHPEGRRAVLHYRTVAAGGFGTWLEIKLETGRNHQIRVQCAARGFPVIGDSQYGSLLPFGPQTDDPRLRSIALHARRLAFSHPKAREPVEAEAPLPACWPPLNL